LRYKNSTDAERFAVARAVIITDVENRAEEKENGSDAATGADEFAEPDAERRADVYAVLRAVVVQMHVQFSVQIVVQKMAVLQK